MSDFPAPAFDGCDIEPILEDDMDRLIRLALLSEAGLSIDEARVWGNLCGKEGS